MAEPTKEQREQSLDLAEYLSSAYEKTPWVEVQARLIEELQKAERRGAEQQLSSVIRQAEQRGAEAERAAVADHVYAQLGDDAEELVANILRGKHLEKPE